MIYNSIGLCLSYSGCVPQGQVYCNHSKKNVEWKNERKKKY